MSRRCAENIIPGFNLVVIDIDKYVSIDTAKYLLEDYKYLLYTTKRHTEKNNRFRIIFPLTHEVKLTATDFKAFMKNVFDWLPFEVDDQASDIARKWMSHDAHYEYNEGKLLDALLFIPKTKKSDVRKKIINDQRSLSNLERWFVNNSEEGNRSNQLVKYALMLVDAGMDIDTIKDKLLGLNNKLEESLDEYEIASTIMITVAKKITLRDSE